MGVSVVGNDARHVDAMLANITRFVEQLGLAPLSNIETEVIPLGGEIGAAGGTLSNLDQGETPGSEHDSPEEEEW